MSPARWLPVTALLVVLVAVYGPLFGAGFSPWDDRLYTAENPLVRDGLTVSGLWRSFTSPWENNWSPVFWIALAAQVTVAGGSSAAVFHSASVLLALLNAVLLGWVARRYALAFPTVLAVVALFAIHPLRVEAVAWISAQKHLLAAAFLLIALLFHQESGKRGGGRFFVLSLGAFALGLMSSQIAVGLPVFLFLWEAGRAGENRWGEALRKTGWYFLLAATAAAATLWVNWRPDAQAVAWFDHPWPHRILQALGSLGWQAAAWLWPAGLATSYPWPGGAVGWYAGLGAALLVIFALWVARVRDRGGLVLAGLGGFFACFLPVSGLLALPIAFTADRLSYVPSIFFTLALGAALDRARQQGRSLPLAICAGWALVLIPVTHRQATFWKDERTIVDRTLSRYPTSVPAQINAATLDALDGRTDEALERFRTIRRSEPQHEVVWSNEVTLLQKLGRTEEALSVGREGAAAIPKSVTLNYQAGLLFAQEGRPAEALPFFRRARELRPRSVQPAYQCARALVEIGEIKEALAILEMLELSLRSDPDYWDLRYRAHDRNGDWQQAKRAREAAGTLRRNRPGAAGQRTD